MPTVASICTATIHHKKLTLHSCRHASHTHIYTYTVERHRIGLMRRKNTHAIAPDHLPISMAAMRGAILASNSSIPSRVPTLDNIDARLLRPARIPSAADNGASVPSAVGRSRSPTYTISEDGLTRDPTFIVFRFEHTEGNTWQAHMHICCIEV